MGEIPSPDLQRSSAADVARGLLAELREMSAESPNNILRALGEMATKQAVLLAVIEHQEERLGQLEHAAMHDALTGLLNRTAFDEQLSQSLSLMSRHNPEGRGLALARIDLDGFGEFNNAYGHDAGDIILQTIGQRLAAGRRQHDLAVRFSGDEFGLCLPGINLEKEAEFYGVADQIHARLGQAIDLGPAGPQVVEASMGLVLLKPYHINRAAQDPGFLHDVRRATDCMQILAKRAGKGRLLVASCDDALTRLDQLSAD